MKLLFDQNLPPKLTGFFAKEFVGSKHLQELSLDSVDDKIVWEYAKTEGFTIVTKDNDFNDLVGFFGFPPKVVWIRRGNCSTNDIIELIESNISLMKAFISDSTNGILHSISYYFLNILFIPQRFHRVSGCRFPALSSQLSESGFSGLKDFQDFWFCRISVF